MTGLIKPLALFKELKIKLPSNPTKWQKVNSFLVGLTFGFAWTPCIGPVLAVILFWASQAETLFQGVALLFVYGIGLGVPFLVIALGFEQLAPKLVKAKAFGKALHLISGLVIILMGFLLITGNVDEMSLTLIRIFGLDEHAI
jgi:cytochrome c-type biogenesis protein